MHKIQREKHLKVTVFKETSVYGGERYSDNNTGQNAIKRVASFAKDP